MDLFLLLWMHKENDVHFRKQRRRNWACRIFLLVTHLFLSIPWCFQVFGWVVFLAMQMPNICQVTWICFFKESCLQIHSHSSSCPAYCCCVGLQTALYYPWLTSYWSNCTNSASVLCSACGSSSTLLCSVLCAGAVVPSLGWSALHTNTLLFAINSAAELLNMIWDPGISVPDKSMGLLLQLSVGLGACALLDACFLVGNSKFLNVAACQLSFSGSVSLYFWSCYYHLKHHFSISETGRLVETSDHLREQEWIFTSSRAPEGLGRENKGNGNRLDPLMGNMPCPLCGGLYQHPWSHRQSLLHVIF